MSSGSEGIGSREDRAQELAADQVSTPDGTRPRRFRWEVVGILAAVVSALTGLTVNAIQLNHQAGEVKRQTAQIRAQTAEFSEQTREFGLQLLSRYYAQVTGASAVLNSHRRRQAAIEGRLSLADNERLSRYLRSSDYVAWLFNRRYLHLPGARDRLGAGLVESYHLASSIYGPEQTKKQFHELAVFVKS